MAFTTLTPEEIERRRKVSIEAWKDIRRTDWERRYQERCDAFYWKHGKCCAGCDHWNSEAGDIGECMDASPMSGEQIIKSLGIRFCSYIPAPGQPYTRRDHVCGQFKDEFDWSTLDPEYLKRIGAKVTAREG